MNQPKITSRVLYNGGLRTESVHLLSGEKIITDAPLDNNGRGAAFSPTDLVATALANCMITIMGIKANSMNVNIDGVVAEVTKIMSGEPRRIAEIIVDITMPKNNYSIKEQKLLEAAGRACPVAKSLHQELKQTITFHW